MSKLFYQRGEGKSMWQGHMETSELMRQAVKSPDNYQVDLGDGLRPAREVWPSLFEARPDEDNLCTECARFYADGDLSLVNVPQRWGITHRLMCP